MQFNLIRFSLQRIVILGILLLTSAVTHAQDFSSLFSGNGGGTSDPSPSSNPFICPSGGTDCLIAGYGVDQQSTWLIQPPPDQAQSMAMGSVLNQMLNLPFNAAQPLTSQSIITLLTTADDKSVIIDSAQLPAVLVKPKACKFSLFSPTPCVGNPIADAQNKATNFSLNSLIGPVVYKTVEGVDQNQSAKNFITWASGLSSPLPVLDFDAVKLPTGTTLAQAQTIPDVAKYLVLLRTYAAQQAVGLSNLYQFYAERVPQKGLGYKANMPDSTQETSESPLQVEQYMATRQIANPAWYTSMQTASPAAISRATLFMLATLPPMLYQIHLDLERLTATMSVLELQQTSGGNRIMIEQARKQAESALSEAANPPTTPSQ